MAKKRKKFKQRTEKKKKKKNASIENDKTTSLKKVPKFQHDNLKERTHNKPKPDAWTSIPDEGKKQVQINKKEIKNS